MSGGTATTSIIFNTPDAVVKNTSRMPMIFVNANIKRAGSGDYAKTYTFPRGKEVCIHPSDYILMRLELEKYYKRGELMLIRDIDGEIRSPVTGEPNLKLNAPHDPLNCGLPLGKDADKAVHRLASREADPPPEEIADDTFWMFDAGTGNIPCVDVDVRARIAGQTYSLMNCPNNANGLCLDIALLNWVLVGGGYYECTLNHNLGANCVNIQIYEGSNQVWLDEITRVDANNHKIRVTAGDSEDSDTDNRFIGQALLIKVS